MLRQRFQSWAVRILDPFWTTDCSHVDRTTCWPLLTHEDIVMSLVQIVTFCAASQGETAMSEAEIVRLGSDNPSWRTVGTLPCYPIWRCLWRTSIFMIPNSWMVSWMTLDDLEVPWQNGKFHDDYIYRERDGLNRGCLWGYFHRLFIGPYMEVPHRLTSTGVLWRRGQKCWWLFCGRRLAMQLGLKKMWFPSIYDHLWIVMVIYLLSSLSGFVCSGRGWNRNSVRKRWSTMKLWHHAGGWRMGGPAEVGGPCTREDGENRRNLRVNATESIAFSSCSHFSGMKRLFLFTYLYERNIRKRHIARWFRLWRRLNMAC